MILFQLYFEVAPERAEEFESTFAKVFLPALSRQQGFRHCKLLRTFPASVTKEIEATPSDYNYQANFVFESEELRRNWAKSADHDVAFAPVSVDERGERGRLARTGVTDNTHDPPRARGGVAEYRDLLDAEHLPAVRRDLLDGGW